MSPYDPQRHHRRSIRLKGYDYTLASAYYVTICVQGGMPLLCNISPEGLAPNAAGQMVAATWDEIPQHYPGVDIDAFVVMPNHIHGIILLTGEGPTGVGADPRVRPDCTHLAPRVRPDCTHLAPRVRPDCVRPDPTPITRLSLADVLQRWKTLTTARYGAGVRDAGWPPYAGRLWQRNYYEQIIRNERQLNAIRAYIEMNPVQWQSDRENPARLP